MIIYIGADHRGFALKGSIVAVLKADGHEVVDIGASALDPTDDYPDFARAVAEKVSIATGAVSGEATLATSTEARGILICGSGFGVDIVANKFKGVRCALAMSPEHIRVGRHDDDVNILSIPADFISPEKALEIARAFLSAPFEKEKEHYVRRLQKIAQIEDGNKK